MTLISGREEYFALLNRLAGNLRHGADLVVRLFDDTAGKAAYTGKIKALERECDGISTEIGSRIKSAFVAPLDRGDLYRLASVLDDVMDAMNRLAHLTIICDVRVPRPEAVGLAETLLNATVELELATDALATPKNVRPHVDRVKELEEEGDRASQAAMTRLFAEEPNSVEVVKWLRIYDELEEGIDRCKDAAKVIEAIVAKRG
jgi:predicted phosphate transport protein (TIGR00153 family)